MRVNRMDFAKFCRDYDFPVKGVPKSEGYSVDELLNLKGVKLKIAGIWYEAEEVLEWLVKDGLWQESPEPKPVSIPLEEVYVL